MRCRRRPRGTHGAIGEKSLSSASFLPPAMIFLTDLSDKGEFLFFLFLFILKVFFRIEFLKILKMLGQPFQTQGRRQFSGAS